MIMYSSHIQFIKTMFFEFVSGLPDIRYPMAIVFDKDTAMFIIPAELETARAFEEGSEAMEYAAFSFYEIRSMPRIIHH